MIIVNGLSMTHVCSVCVSTDPKPPTKYNYAYARGRPKPDTKYDYRYNWQLPRPATRYNYTFYRWVGRINTTQYNIIQ